MPQRPALNPCPAASVLWLPYQAYTLLLRPARPPPPAGEGSGAGAGAGAAAPSGSPLGDSALLLLLVLLFHAPPQVTVLRLQGLSLASIYGGLPCVSRQLSSWHWEVRSVPSLIFCFGHRAADEPVLQPPPVQDAPFGNPYRQSLQRLQDADDLGAQRL